MTPRQKAILLARAVAALPIEAQCIVVMYLLEGKLVPPDADSDRDHLACHIRATWLGGMKADDAAAKKLERDVRRFAAGAYRSHENCFEVPRVLRGSYRGDLWRLLKLGRPLTAERYRQIFRAGKKLPPEITSEPEHNDSAPA
ncbi:hypothetical protein ACVWZ6_005593 [Bradyrhizobium sp. GM6.1]